MSCPRFRGSSGGRTVAAMTEFLLELTSRGRTPLLRARRRGELAWPRQVAAHGSAVRCVRSIFVAEDVTCFLLYAAASAEPGLHDRPACGPAIRPRLRSGRRIELRPDGHQGLRTHRRRLAMSQADQQSSPASFYASPAEALQAPPEEFLYLACLHEGTGVTSRTSSPSSMPRTAGSCTRRRCRTSATSCTTSAGTAAAPPATGPTART